MKNKFIFLAITALMTICGSPPSIRAQGTFVNLNFESATLSPIPTGQLGSFVPIADGLPGWMGYLGTTMTSQVLQNNISTGAASIDIWGPDLTAASVIDGNYSVVLQAGGIGIGEGNASIAPDGTIPETAQSLQFKVSAVSDFSGSVFSVSFAGNTLSPIVISTGQNSGGLNYDLYGVNVASFAGQSGQLEFTSIFNSAGPSSLELDDILFSPTLVVPEPSIVALSAIGGLLFGARKWFARS